MVVVRCATFEGDTYIVEDDPSVGRYRNVTYVPSEWLLYDHGKKAISASAYFRGPKPDLIGHYTTEHSYRLIEDEAPDPVYFYVGALHIHYGHFILASLARMWAYNREKHSGLKLLTYGCPAEAAQLAPFMSTFLAALGVSFDDLISFDRPMRIREVIIPSPCFEETNFAHRAFARMTAEIGKIVLAGSISHQSDTPIYLARYGLTGGVHNLANEEEFASALSKQGVEIVFPECMSVNEQIRLLTDRSNITGFSGSALHTTAFVSLPRTMLNLNYMANPLSNQVLIDRVCGHKAVYLYSPDGIETLPASAEFTLRYRLLDPKRMADEVLRILEPFMRSPPTKNEDALAAYGAADCSTHNGIVRPNIALKRPTKQSSTEGFSRGLSRTEDSAGAVCGFCTGSYQFHTALEPQPWWEVDLESRHRIEEVRLFNRLDSGQERCARFTISLSDNGQIWVIAFERQSDTPFGGFDGKPFVWKPAEPVEGRYVRITVMATTYLHLDQVVVYGLPL